MANIISITDLSAPELAVFSRLTEAQLRNKQHPAQGLFIAETHKVIAHALDAGCEPAAFLIERRQLTGLGAPLIARCPDTPVYTADSDTLQKLTGFALTRGMLCAMRRPAQPTVEAVCAGARRIAVLEGIVDASNLGAVFRSAAALGIDGVLLTPNCCDPLYRRAVRVSMGTVFQLPWARIGDGWPHPALDRLKAMGFATAALALDDRAVTVEHPGLMAEEKLAILLGTEGDGLHPQTIAACDYTVCIPMSHGVDSLNVAAASAVAFWQLRVR